MNHPWNAGIRVGANHQLTNVGDPLFNDDWWERQRIADEEFQARLRAAGIPEGVDKRPCTKNPHFVERQHEVRSASKLTWPATPSW